MKYLSLFSGIGGFDLGFDRAGLECIGQVEIDKQCNKVLHKHWPNVPRFTDIKNFNEKDFKGKTDIICGGFPCQDLSLAGWSAGLTGKRSRLWFEFERLIYSICPKIFVIENVPGLFSSNKGRDLFTVLQGVAKFGYGVAWRVFDLQYFGIPQQRKRVFIVGYFGNIRSAAEILFERTSVPMVDRKSTKTKPTIAHCLASGTSRGYRIEPNENFAISFETRIARNGRGQPSKIVRTLHSSDTGAHGDSQPHIAGTYGIRRLTPKEYERLQSFPDDWTKEDAQGKEISDSARYRMLGNAVAPIISEYLGRKMLCV